MIAGLILAAGAGSRYGSSPKLLADLGGRPLLEHAIEAQCLVPELDPIAVVLGAHSAAILERVDFMRARPVLCASWREGIAASLRCGSEALSDARRVIVTLGDEPLMSPKIITRFLDAAPGTRATYDGQPGHPVVLGSEQLRGVAELSGDRGARELLRGGPTIECGALGPRGDVDTPEDLETVRPRVRSCD
ncbi:MAG: nucleotidyltransferase family protein [Solirubrobacteraceae bacterium]